MSRLKSIVGGRRWGSLHDRRRRARSAGRRHFGGRQQGPDRDACKRSLGFSPILAETGRKRGLHKPGSSRGLPQQQNIRPWYRRFKGNSHATGVDRLAAALGLEIEGYLDNSLILRHGWQPKSTQKQAHPWSFYIWRSQGGEPETVGDMPRPKMLSSSESIAPKGCAAVGGSAVGPATVPARESAIG